ncbi:MAG: hypothetical protein EHM12_05815 [Dehalococcoidia bacterium]|nr:MAG: hypothetical protein EHM12_05815 [Dehalococcoidia bacterium]
MSKKAIFCGLFAIIALTFMWGCQSNISATSNEAQDRLARIEEKMSKLESAILEKNAIIDNLNQQIDTLKNQNSSLLDEFHQYKTYADNKFAVNDIDIEKLMWNIWLSLGLPIADKPYLNERYGELNKSPLKSDAAIMRPILWNKLVNKPIANEYIPLSYR